jgi:hypothetical protein
LGSQKEPPVAAKRELVQRSFFKIGCICLLPETRVD